MFRKAKNLDMAFQQVRNFTLLVVLGCLALSSFVIYRSLRMAAQVQSRVYVLADGKAFPAVAGSREENIGVEGRDHVRTFHHYFFSLDPDEKVIEDNIEQALHRADGSAASVYRALKENSYYAGIISGNISQQLSPDSIGISTAAKPYFFRFRGTVTITRPSTITTRSLITEGYLRTVARSDNNPHGFLIERWKIIENKDLKTENR